MTKLFIILLGLCMPLLAFGKGPTVLISIRGETLSKNIDLSDPRVLDKFSIWSGPGARSRVGDGPWITSYDRTFIDFGNGTLGGVPDGLETFEVDFFIGAKPGAEPNGVPFSVTYATRAGSLQGYVYLPSRTPYIYHGVDGWFRATEAWDSEVLPVIRQHQSQK